MDSELREALITHAADAMKPEWFGTYDAVTATKLANQSLPARLIAARKAVDALLAYTIPCPTCEGEGVNYIEDVTRQMWPEDCGACSGSGRVPALTETQP